MDHRFETIQSHIEGCLLQASVFERSVDGAQLFEEDIVSLGGGKWLVLAAGISHNEADKYFHDGHQRERATIPMQVSPYGEASMLLITRPRDPNELLMEGKFVTRFSSDIGWVELRQGCYVRVDGLQTPVVRQIRWELDPGAGQHPPMDNWLRPWARIVGCNPAHAPSHWHINSPPIEEVGPRRRRRAVVPPELRLATGLPNPLLLLLSLANWLRLIYNNP